MDKQTASRIQEEALKALKPIADRLGLEVRAKGGSLDPSYVMLRFEFAQVTQSGVVMTSAARDFQVYASAFGLESSDLGAEIDTPRGLVRIVGAKPRATKYPILCQAADGSTFKFSADGVRRALALKRA